MEKKHWIWIVCGALFPPLFLIPLIYYFIYRPLKDGTIGGGHLRFYFWGSFITSLSLLANLPIRNLTRAYEVLNVPSNAQTFIYCSFALAILSIVMLFFSVRNEPDRKLFLPIKTFKPDLLFFICLLLTLLPFLSLFSTNVTSIDKISHPFLYAISILFTNQSYFAVVVGIMCVSITTGILEESFFRGILLRDYFQLGKTGQRLLLGGAALYFAICHIPISFVSPLIFGLFLNRIRIAYNNLLPSIILHALWNAFVTIALLISLNGKAPVKPASFAQELAVTQHIWAYKSVDSAQKLFKDYEDDKDGMIILKGKFLEMMIAPDSTEKNKIKTAFIIFNKALPASEVEYYFDEGKDWKTSVFKKTSKEDKPVDQELTCSEQLDICFRPDSRGIRILYLGVYHSSVEL